MQVSQQEENQSISQKTEIPKIVDAEKPPGKFTKKHFLIALAVFLILAQGTAIGLLVVFIPKDNYIAVTVFNQRNDFTQKDEICFYHENQAMQNCTEVYINTTRVPVAQDYINLPYFKLPKENDFYDLYAEINQEINDRIRFSKDIFNYIRVLNLQ